MLRCVLKQPVPEFEPEFPMTAVSVDWEGYVALPLSSTRNGTQSGRSSRASHAPAASSPPAPMRHTNGVVAAAAAMLRPPPPAAAAGAATQSSPVAKEPVAPTLHLKWAQGDRVEWLQVALAPRDDCPATLDRVYGRPLLVPVQAQWVFKDLLQYISARYAVLCCCCRCHLLTASSLSLSQVGHCVGQAGVWCHHRLRRR